MHVITKDMLRTTTRQAGESHLFGFTQEASCLGFKPGEWPIELVLEDSDYGNPILHRCTYLRAGDPDSGWTYRDAGGVFKIDVKWED